MDNRKIYIYIYIHVYIKPLVVYLSTILTIVTLHLFQLNQSFLEMCATSGLIYAIVAWVCSVVPLWCHAYDLFHCLLWAKFLENISSNLSCPAIKQPTLHATTACQHVIFLPLPAYIYGGAFCCCCQQKTEKCSCMYATHTIFKW